MVSAVLESVGLIYSAAEDQNSPEDSCAFHFFKSSPVDAQVFSSRFKIRLVESTFFFNTDSPRGLRGGAIPMGIGDLYWDSMILGPKFGKISRSSSCFFRRNLEGISFRWVGEGLLFCFLVININSWHFGYRPLSNFKMWRSLFNSSWFSDDWRSLTRLKCIINLGSMLLERRCNFWFNEDQQIAIENSLEAAMSVGGVPT